MNTTLFFLRSSEQKIAHNMLPHALCLESAADCSLFELYTSTFGLKSSDIGIYALTDNEISGAAWIRLFKESDEAIGYVDNEIPVLIIGVMPNARGKGIGSLMINQLLEEAAAMYDNISIQSSLRAVSFFERLGFVPFAGSEKKSMDTLDAVIMVKKLVKKEIVRPTDGYDPRRWMD